MSYSSSIKPPSSPPPDPPTHPPTQNQTTGAIIERVTKQPLDVFMTERLFKPLNMKDTGTSLPPTHPSLPSTQLHASLTHPPTHPPTHHKTGFYVPADELHRLVVYWTSAAAPGILTPIPFMYTHTDFARKPRLLSGGGGTYLSTHPPTHPPTTYLPYLINDPLPTY